LSVPENLEILIPWRITTDTSEKNAEPLTAELSSVTLNDQRLNLQNVKLPGYVNWADCTSERSLKDSIRSPG
jgi:hypothetical protein